MPHYSQQTAQFVHKKEQQKRAAKVGSFCDYFIKVCLYSFFAVREYLILADTCHFLYSRLYIQPQSTAVVLTACFPCKHAVPAIVVMVLDIAPTVNDSADFHDIINDDIEDRIIADSDPIVRILAAPLPSDTVQMLLRRKGGSESPSAHQEPMRLRRLGFSDDS